MPDIVITPNRGTTNNPKIDFTGTSAGTIKLEVLSDGTIAWNGANGSLFSIADSLSGSLMSVNDISGLPAFEVFSDNRVVVGQFGANLLLGKTTSSSNGRLQLANHTTVAGGIGIGTDINLYRSAAGSLSIASSANPTQFKVSTTTAGGYSQIYLSNPTRDFILTNNAGDNVLSFYYGGANRLQFDTSNQWFNSGNVGIGTTSPGYKLDVNGEGAFVSNSSARVLYLKQNAANTGNIIQFRNEAGGDIWELVARNSQFYIYNNVLSSFALYIAPGNNNVGIATTSPSYKLHVEGDSYSSTGFYVRNSAATFIGSLNNMSGISVNGTSYDTFIVSGGSQTITVKSGGNVGINQTSPSYKLDVGGTTNTTRLNVAGYTMRSSATIDMSNTGTYSTSNFYPVTIPLSGYAGSHAMPIRMRILNSLNSNVPSWSTHGSGFTCHVEWTTNGSGWGTIAVQRAIHRYTQGFANSIICGGITQLTNDSIEVIWLRGGGIYYFEADADVTPTPRSTNYTAPNGETANVVSVAVNNVIESALNTNPSFSRLNLTQSTGTAPFTVSSTTQVTNLNAQYLNGYSSDTANTANTIVRRDGSGNFSAGTITATLAGLATSETLSTVTGRGATTASQISVNSSAGGSMLTGTKAGGTYGDGVSGATFKSILDNANGGAAFAFSSYYGGSGGTLGASIRADGYAYFKEDVGIGTNSPSGKLDVRVAGTGTWDRFIVNTTTSWGDGSTQYVTIGAGGAAGIMLSNPHVVWNSGNSAAGIRMGRSGGVSTGGWYEIGTGTSDSFHIKRESTTRLYIDTNGNVGIGTTSPSNKLHLLATTTQTTINANDNQFLIIENTANGSQGLYGIGFKAQNGVTQAGIFAFNGTNGGGNGDLRFYTRNTSGTFQENMRISDGGNVGIGQTSPSYKLDVSGTLRSTTDAYFATSSGSVGIGNTSPSYKLHVSGDIYANGGWFRVSGTQGYYFQDYGGGWFMNDSTWIRAYNDKAIITNNEIRGTIFVDANDTGYYVNPATGTNLNGTLVNNGGTAMTGGWNRNLLLSSTFPVIVFNSNSTKYSGIGVDYSNTAAGMYFWVNGSSADISGTATVALGLNTGNYVTAYGSFRAPIFYDSDNTGYYCNPASTSRFSTVDFGTSGYYIGAGDWGMRHTTPYGWIQFGPANASWAHIYASQSIYFNTNTYVNGNWMLYENTWQNGKYFETSGVIYSQASMRAPIFYDYNDTNYYVDPASTSYLYEPRMAWRSLVGEQSYDATLFDGGTSYRPGIVIRGNYPHIDLISSNINNGSHGPTLRFVAYDSANVATGNFKHWVMGCAGTNATRFSIGYDANQSNPHYGIYGAGTSAIWIENDFNVYFQSSIRPTIIYDRNDTGYYIDPSNTAPASSNLRGRIHISGGHYHSSLRVFLPSSENGGGSGTAALQMWCSEPGNTWDGAGFGYNVDHTENNGGSAPAYYFGRVNTSLGQSYMRFLSGGDWYFYNTNTSGTRTLSLGLGSDGIFYAYNHIRTPYIYDYNNTAYYFDGNNTSVMNLVTVNSLGVGTSASGTTGEIRATNNITAYYSDERLKTRLGKIEDPIEKVKSLSGFYFEANETAVALGYDKKREVGVSAQEVQAVLPEIIAPAPISDKYMTVRYEKLIPLLIEAIKEQQTQIEQLSNELKSLKNKL